MYSYLTDVGCVGKKAKGRKKCIVKHDLKFVCIKTCQENKKTVLKDRFRSDAHNIFYKKANKTMMKNEYRRLMESSRNYMTQTELFEYVKLKN